MIPEIYVSYYKHRGYMTKEDDLFLHKIFNYIKIKKVALGASWECLMNENSHKYSFFEFEIDSSLIMNSNLDEGFKGVLNIVQKILSSKQYIVFLEFSDDSFFQCLRINGFIKLDIAAFNKKIISTY